MVKLVLFRFDGDCNFWDGGKLKENYSYRKYPKFSDKQVWANSENPDQTAPSGAV